MLGITTGRVRAKLTLPWQPVRVVKTRLQLTMVFQVRPPKGPREGRVKGAVAGGSVVAANLAASLIFDDASSIAPAGSTSKQVASMDSLAHRTHMAATAGEPIRDGRPVWLAVAPARLAMVDRTGQIRWSSDSGELIDVQRTDAGLRLVFRDYSVQVITMSAWTRRRILRAWQRRD